MSTLTSTQRIPLRQWIGIGQALRASAAMVRGTLRTWRERARSRRELRELDDYLLRDIGVSRGEADFIASKPFWRE